MNWKDLHESRLIRGILIGIIATLAVILIFQAGVFVGIRKASYSYRLGDNYYRAFKGTSAGAMKTMSLEAANVSGGHGAVGRIISVTPPTMIVVDEGDSVEKTVIFASTTMVKRFDRTISPDEINEDEYAVVLGYPDEESRIMAKFIRLAPPPEALQVRR